MARPVPMTILSAGFLILLALPVAVKPLQAVRSGASGRDLIAVLALYRPGPLGGGMVESYVNRKHGRETWTYPHPVMKEILDETYGVQVYQEQIMRVLNRLGGIELSVAYALIKAIG